MTRLRHRGRRTGQTVVSLTFDDGWACQFRYARPILNSFGMRATFFVNSNLVGGADRMTWEDLEALAADGHEIGGHTLDHPDLTSLEQDEVRRQVCEDRDVLVARGFSARSFAYPGGAYDAALTAIVRVRREVACHVVRPGGRRHQGHRHQADHDHPSAGAVR